MKSQVKLKNLGLGNVLYSKGLKWWFVDYKVKMDQCIPYNKAKRAKNICKKAKKVFRPKIPAL